MKSIVEKIVAVLFVMTGCATPSAAERPPHPPPPPPAQSVSDALGYDTATALGASASQSRSYEFALLAADPDGPVWWMRDAISNRTAAADVLLWVNTQSDELLPIQEPQR